MGKYLLEPDYEKAVFSALKLAKIDYFNHYSNFANDYYMDNRDLFERLTLYVRELIKQVRYIYNNPNGFRWDVDLGEWYAIIENDGVSFGLTESLLNEHLTAICEVKLHLDTKTVEKPAKISKPALYKLKTILDIWRPDNTKSMNEYHRQLEYLKMENPTIEGAFLILENGAWKWNGKLYGSIQYLAGWLHICIKRNWIPKGLSASIYASILKNTFHIKMSSTSFKGIDERPPYNEKYCAPFKNIPQNLQVTD